MNAEERTVFIDTYGFDPGECECHVDEAEENMLEITMCHAGLLDKFVEQCKVQHEYIKEREAYVAEIEMRVSLLGHGKLDG